MGPNDSHTSGFHNAAESFPSLLLILPLFRLPFFNFFFYEGLNKVYDLGLS